MTPLLENILNQAVALKGVGSARLEIERAAEILSSKKKIVLTGMGASYFACIPFHYKTASTCIETSELLYFLQSRIDSDTAVVVVSRSGESVEAIKLLPALRQTGAAIVGMTNVPGSTLTKQADHTILLNSPADQLVAIQTYTATLAVFALLHAAIRGELEQAQLELNSAIGILENWIPKLVEARNDWKPFLDGNWPIYILGRGSALGAVHEGALLMHETAKFPAIGMSVAQFRHGPVEVVDANFHAIVIGTQPETAELDAALAEDLTKMGAHVVVLGASAAPQRFASIFETIPLQIAAYTKAEMNGIRPGDFRWATAVTSVEAGFKPQS